MSKQPTPSTPVDESDVAYCLEWFIPALLTVSPVTAIHLIDTALRKRHGDGAAAIVRMPNGTALKNELIGEAVCQVVAHLKKFANGTRIFPAGDRGKFGLVLAVRLVQDFEKELRKHAQGGADVQP